MVRCGIWVLVLATVVSGQWLETSIFLPDSVGGPVNPERIFYNPGNNNVFIFGADPTVLVLDGNTGRKIGRIDLRQSAGGFCYNYRENKIYVAGGGVTVIDAAGSRVLKILDLGYYSRDICYNPNLNRVYAVGESRVTVIDAAEDTIIRIITLPNYSAGDIACATQVNKVYCILNNEDVAVIDCATDSIIKIFYSGAGPYEMLYNHLANRLYIAEGYDEDITVVDCDRDTVLRWLVAGYEPGLMCLNPVSNKFYCADWSRNWFGIYDARADTLIRWLYLGNFKQSGLVFDSIDNLVYVSLFSQDSVAVIDGVSDEVLRTVPIAGRNPYGLAYNPRQQLIYCAEYASASVSFYNAPTSEPVGSVQFFRYEPRILTYISGMDRIYCANPNLRSIIPLSCAQNHIREQINLSTLPKYFSYAPAVNRAYAFSVYDSTIVVIDCAAETVRKVIRLPGKPGNAVYAPDSNRIYCALLVPEDERIAMINCTTDSITGEFGTLENPVILGYLPDYHRLYFVEGEQRRLVAYDVLSHQRIAEMNLGGEPAQICFIPDLNLLGVRFAYAEYLLFIDCANHTIRSALGIPQGTARMIYNPLNNLIYLATYSDTIMVIAPEQPMVVDTIPVNCYFDNASLTLDTIANKLYLSGSYQNSLVVIDCQANRVCATIPLNDYPAALTWSPPNRRMYVAVPGRAAVAVIRDSSVVGMAEQPLCANVRQTIPTVVRGSLNLNTGFFVNGGPVFLLDASGRRCRNLYSGNNDLRGLAPGVYFLVPREKSGRNEIRKLIVTR